MPPAGEVPAALVLDEALNLVERRAFYAERVDWPSVRAEARRRVAAATTRAEVYEVIRWVLSRLGDHHSFLLTPQRAAELAVGRGRDFGLLAMFPERVVVDVEPGDAAERAGVRVGDVVEAVDGRLVQGEEVVTLPASGPARARAASRAHRWGPHREHPASARRRRGAVPHRGHRGRPYRSHLRDPHPARPAGGDRLGPLRHPG
ncbi:MAG TPA: PDZ domain-containing protein [Actinomycetes bacterium]|nr:PDZ domain-containing protein [Actinomycetes bacterium]